MIMYLKTDCLIPYLRCLCCNRNHTQKAFFLTNVACESPLCASYGRTFSIVWNTQLSGIEAAVQTSFFDLYEDVSIVLDIGYISVSHRLTTYRHVRMASYMCDVMIL